MKHNTVHLIGTVAATPRPIGAADERGEQVFNLRLKVHSGFADDCVEFVPLIGVWRAEGLPAWLRRGQWVEVQGWVRTRNLTRLLRTELSQLCQRAQLDGALSAACVAQIPASALCKRVIVEVVATQLQPYPLPRLNGRRSIERRRPAPVADGVSA